MKKYLIILLCLLPSFLYGTDYYIATDGNDGAAGDIDHPWANWSKLESVSLNAGDIVYIRGGTYRSTRTGSANAHVRFVDFTGTSFDTIKIWAYPGETPILNFDNINVTAGYCFGLYITNCSYIHIKGLRVTGLSQPLSGISVTGIFFNNLNHGVIENCVVDNVGGHGFVWEYGADILVKNCDAHHLANPYAANPYGGADGFSATGSGNTATNITFNGCRTWLCSDDGFDFYNSDGYFELDSCWAFWNGYDEDFNHLGDGCGFKIGRTHSNQSTARKIVTNCVAVHNYYIGFNQNTVDYYNPVILYNNTSYLNGDYGYMFGWGPAGGTSSIFRNNISYNDVYTFTGETVDIVDHNSWNAGWTVSDADFVSLDTSQLDGARQADGSLPVLTLLHLAATSDMINTGVDVGIAYNSTAPDLGAFEYTEQVFGKSGGKFGKHNGKLVRVNR